MKTSDFDYYLPRELIAQTPCEPRDHSRLMVVHRRTGALEHRRFFELDEYLKSGDLLILNNSRVIPAKLVGRKIDGGGRVDLLLLWRVEPGVWEALARPLRRLRPGMRVQFRDKEGLLAEVLDRTGRGTLLIRLGDEALLGRVGQIPLPPYIRTPLQDPERYQTVYGQVEGSVAAPTAGLHFTPELMARLCEKGVEFAFVTLHVGLGSFRPVKVDNPEKHELSPEYCEVGPETAQKVNSAREEGRRVVCIGTTTVRALEGAINASGQVRPFQGWNDLYILPGHRFRVVDALLTNFHLPRSTLLMLVCAFAGRELVFRAYEEAIRRGYRFYSFGDAMLIL
ncbi:MAG: tRNA preQ1(34) S-adenosylmethionine ribosyltransferase-isomerase QueA [Chloroflexi bacterium]|nr:MAG: tRNA preQ1(34) S-adenosylmethionine ribosyltransferase-isomerase QueA [Chloroflexota bacterium]